jgi:hypothetical protein
MASVPILQTNLEKQAKAAWDRYGSCVRTGGTPEQRRFAFDQAMALEEKVGKVNQAERLRLERAKTQKPAA